MISAHRLAGLAVGLTLLAADCFALAPQPPIITRAEWGARPPQCSISQCTAWEHSTIHHTASSGDYSVSDHSECYSRVRAHQNYHMDSNGWCDIGYNFLVCKHGYIFEGREGSIDSYPRGAHDSINCPGIGACLMGYFHRPYNNEPTPEMLSALTSLIAWQWDALGRSPYGTGTYGGNIENIIGGHRDVGSTACPGDIMYNNYITSDPNTGWVRNDTCAKMETCTGSGVPAAPGNLTGTAVSSSEVDLSWTDNSGDEDSFVLERKGPTKNSSYSVIATLGANVASYRDTGLSGNSSYTYRVKACNATGCSDYSNEATVKTLR